MFLSISTTALASDLSDIRIGPHCRHKLAPVLCAIKHQRTRTNHWRRVGGSEPYSLKRSIYRTDRAHRIHALARWQRRRDNAKAFVDTLWTWVRQPAVWCVHTNESVSWDWHGAHDGGFQYLVSTWIRAGGGRYAPRADLAAATIQIRITRHYTRLHGWNEWSTAQECGL